MSEVQGHSGYLEPCLKRKKKKSQVTNMLPATSKQRANPMLQTMQHGTVASANRADAVFLLSDVYSAADASCPLPVMPASPPYDSFTKGQCSFRESPQHTVPPAPTRPLPNISRP